MGGGGAEGVAGGREVAETSRASWAGLDGRPSRRSNTMKPVALRASAPSEGRMDGIRRPAHRSQQRDAGKVGESTCPGPEAPGRGGCCCAWAMTESALGDRRPEAAAGERESERAGRQSCRPQVADPQAPSQRERGRWFTQVTVHTGEGRDGPPGARPPWKP